MFPLSLFGFNISATMAKIFGIAIAAFFIFVIYPRADDIKEFFGMDTVRSLKKENTEQKAQLTQIQQTNVDNVKEMDRLKKTQEQTLVVLAELSKSRESNIQFNARIEKERKTALEELKRVLSTHVPGTGQSFVIEPFSGNQIDITLVDPSAAVSMIQMGSIWATYCRNTLYQNGSCDVYKKIQESDIQHAD